MTYRILLVASLTFALGCEGGNPTAAVDDMPLGDVSADDMKADGNWGAALTCKPVPALPRLTKPRITVSLNGLTLRLSDDAGGFNKVFPIGPGAIEHGETAAGHGESKSYYPVIAAGTHDFAITPSSIQPCKTWWTDAATGEKSPVFAGLPFMSWSGAYAIHGPVDNYRAANGGNLRRGFVSHGCIRMEAADVLEVYARIKGVAKVPVHVQREAERDANGARIDVPARWLGAECAVDADCNFTGGFCKANRYSGRSFCSVRCTSTCADRAGLPTTFCVTDPDDATKGLCVPKMVAQNEDCRPLDHFVARTVARFKQPGVTATACVPGSPGWVGDHCFADSDCQTGNSCEGATASAPGQCTQGCTRYCPDMPGWPSTFCVNDPALGGAACARECTPASNASECPGDTSCVPRTRNGDAATTRNVCL
ncbi:MAG TPA: L,D-transpeptidase [Polyangia bacterium]|jgi:hypothetical protein